MKRLRVTGFVLAITCNTAAGQQNTAIIQYSDVCDASAAAAISAEMFIVASDENKVLSLKNCTKCDRKAQSFGEMSPILRRATTFSPSV